jgi:hypothetical protein
VRATNVAQGRDNLFLKIMRNDLALCSFEYASLWGKQQMVVVCSYHIEKDASFFNIESFSASIFNVEYLELTTSLEQK